MVSFRKTLDGDFEVRMDDESVSAIYNALVDELRNLERHEEESNYSFTKQYRIMLVSQYEYLKRIFDLIKQK